MLKKNKVKRIDNPFFLNGNRKNNKSADFSQVNKPAKIVKAKVTQILPFLMGIDHEFYQRNFIHSLKESLTVKRVEFSPPKTFAGLQISTIPLHTKVSKRIVQRINSYKSISITKTRKQKTVPKEPKKLKKSESPVIAKIITNAKKEALARPLYTPQPIKTLKSLPKMCYKEALRIATWNSKAKPELNKMWRKIIAKSNGIDPVESEAIQYKFFVGKGNNSRLILKCFNSRPWWIEETDIFESNFAWTQWKEKKIIEKLKIGKDIKNTKTETLKVALISPINLKVENGKFRSVDLEDLSFHIIRNSNSYTFLNSIEVSPISLQMHNKIEYNQHLSNKKGLFRSLKSYYSAIGKNIFDYVPLTFHVIKGEEDPEFLKFQEEFNVFEEKRVKNIGQNLWIIKPGENTNRGQGISLANSLVQIKDLISSSSSSEASEKHTFIIQKYIERPFLIHRRKFDIRCYALITSINGVIQSYFYNEGYLRTTSTEYNTKEIFNNFIHLTNDAIQKNSEEYGKFEDGNKLSYKDFQRYLDFHWSEKKINFICDILPNIKNLVKDTILACFSKIDPNRRLHCMEIFGYDFMLDVNLKPWLIEVNTNPCLELSSSYLTSLIPAMVDNALRIAVDPLFPPPTKMVPELSLENKFELIFHQEVDGPLFFSQIGEKKEDFELNEKLSDSEEYFSDNE